MNTTHINQEYTSLRVGMYNLLDGSIVEQLDEKSLSKVRSIVAYIDDTRHYAIGLCPIKMMLPFALGCLQVNTEHIKSGKEATLLLLEEAEKQEVELPAAEFCRNYDFNGVNKGEAFLPSKLELSGISHNSLWAAWKKLGLFTGDRTFWSSTVGIHYNAWMNSCSSAAVSGWQIQYRTFGFMPAVEIVY